MSEIKAIVVDDEFLARENLKLFISEYCKELNVVGEAGNIENALVEIKSKEPDVIFVDIRMPSGLEGFELIERIPDPKPIVVFVTAFKEYAIRAFKANALDYILKPVEIDELIKVTEKVTELIKSKTSSEPAPYDAYLQNLQQLTESFNRSKSKRISVSHSKGIKLINEEDIVHLRAEGNCTELHFANGEKYLDTRTLKVYEDMLSSITFYRVHKSHIINIDYLKEYSSEGGYFAILKNGDIINVSRSRVSEFIEFIKNLHR